MVLNRAGASKPIQLDVDDLGWPDGLEFLRFGGGPSVEVKQGKISVVDPREINIYWNRVM